MLDLFATALDVNRMYNDLAQESCFWNEEYENPDDPRINLQETDDPYEKTINAEIAHITLDHNLRKRTTEDPDAKLQIVARYLAEALREGAIQSGNAKLLEAKGDRFKKVTTKNKQASKKKIRPAPVKKKK